MRIFLWILSLTLTSVCPLSAASVSVGADQVFEGNYDNLFKGRRVGLITNHTAVNSEMRSTIDLFKTKAKEKGFTLTTLFGPEHGIHGACYAETGVDHQKDSDGIPIYSLHGKTRRPSKDMLKNVDILVYDIQDIGSRSYTYVSTLFYVMEVAAKNKIPVVVLDRPNPINGLVVDGPMLDAKWRSFVGYINVPYCHGMTVGELASFFNTEYRIGCKLQVVPMKGWQRSMTFHDTGLPWVPTSPNIPDIDTPCYYPATGILGELQIVNIGVGYTLPFKVVGAPWIHANTFAKHLNAQKFPGVRFYPFHYRPFFGRFSGEDCQGVLIDVYDTKTFKPVATQYLILGILKGLYPSRFRQAMAGVKDRIKMFNKVNGTEEIYRILSEEKYVVWKLKAVHQKERDQFKERRKKYLIAGYG